jgi:hypothetical protein
MAKKETKAEPRKKAEAPKTFAVPRAIRVPVLYQGRRVAFAFSPSHGPYQVLPDEEHPEAVQIATYPHSINTTTYHALLAALDTKTDG